MKKRIEAKFYSFFTEFFTRIDSNDCGKKNITAAIDYGTWTRLQNLTERKNSNLNSVCMNIIKDKYDIRK